ncbi:MULTISPECIES: alpha/beta fold hydrolase [unclassified Knoellia]|uniref:alpha/beta fold hydrolase n=1 Tax=Knoellia altitudinis TaxID=3404795 RepID=UPI00362010DF
MTGALTEPFAQLHPASRPSQSRDSLPVVLLHGGNVASWMWEPQLAALSHRTVITPDLPGFGSRTEETWPGLGGAADDVVHRVEALTGHRRFHVVGLSLGGLVALHLAARHPGSVASVLASGAPLQPVRGLHRLSARLQLALWERPWFWRAQAAAFRLPPDSRGLYVSHGLSVRRDTARGMLDEIHAGASPTGLDAYAGPMLLVAGEREARVVRTSMNTVTDLPSGAHTRLAPGMHHVWSIEDPDLFGDMITAWLDGRVEPRLLPADERAREVPGAP